MSARSSGRGSTGVWALLLQFGRFLVVGLLSFSVDFGLFVLMHEVLGVQYIVASTTSFSISLVLNYYLTVRFVFETRAERNAAAEFALYIGLNVVALGLNQLVLLISVEVLGVDPVIGKLVATAIVLIFNFVSRKALIEKGVARRRPESRSATPDGRPSQTPNVPRTEDGA